MSDVSDDLSDLDIETVIEYFDDNPTPVSNRLKRALRELQRLRASPWRPIEEAPRDGTWILVLCPESIQDPDMPKPCVFTTRWVQETWETWERVSETRKEKVVTDHSHWECYERPTHWQPLPEPPTSDHPRRKP